MHRCLVRHGISRLPKGEESASKRKRVAETKIGYVHIGACELCSAEGKVHLFLTIDRVSKFAYVELHPAATLMIGAAFLRSVIEAFPYRIHTVLTDNGTPFASQPRYCSGPTARSRGHAFKRVCREHGIAHRLTKPYHPGTNGQAERMNWTIKDATVKRGDPRPVWVTEASNRSPGERGTVKRVSRAGAAALPYPKTGITFSNAWSEGMTKVPTAAWAWSRA